MENNPDKSPKELVQELYEMFSSFKQRMEDPNYIQLENTLSQLVENQMEMKQEMKELKRQLLNPFDGVIVETRKNTEYVKSLQAKEAEFNKLMEEHKSLVNWKSNMIKFGITSLTVIGGIITFLLNKYLGE
jgi:uncharacterized protein YdcH (DUF465 family)